ncbi:MAG: trigger factor [Acidobacteriota bacterium]
MSVVTAVEETGPCRLKLTIEVPAPAVDAELGRVVQEFRRHARLPGFRPGKVPKSLIQSRFKDEIEREVVDRLLPRYWKQAEAEKDLDPLMPPQVEDLKFESGEPMTVVAVVETRPEIPLGDIETFDLPEEPGEAADAEIEDAVADLRRNFAEWTVVERAAAQGDMVVGSILRIDDGADDDEESRPFHFEIGAEGADEELSLALTGKKAGQSVEHEKTFGGGAKGEGDEADSEGESEAETRTFEIAIDEVKEQELPELNDELAAQIGGFETVTELREAVAKSLTDRKKGEVRRERQAALLRQLRERHPLTLPEGVVEQEIERLVREMAETLMRQGVDLQAAEVDWERMAADMRPQAEQRVHERLLLDAVAKAEDQRLDEARFEQFLGAVASQQGTTSQALRQRLSEDGRIEALRAQLLRDQTLAHLLGEELDEAQAAEAGSELVDEGDAATSEADDPYALDGDDEDPYDLSDDQT